jgi:hypothetical protein
MNKLVVDLLQQKRVGLLKSLQKKVCGQEVVHWHASCIALALCWIASSAPVAAFCIQCKPERIRIRVSMGNGLEARRFS